MKKVLFGALVAATALFSACGGSKQPAATGDLKDEVDSLSYAVGLSQSPTPEQDQQTTTKSSKVSRRVYRHSPDSSA